MPDSYCIFCSIVDGRADRSVVHEDDLVVAFMDIRPVTTGHLLVVPRRHAVGLADLEPGDGERMFRVAQRMAEGVRRGGLPCQGVNLFLADGVVAGQEVFHVHLHVIPRTRGDGFGLRLKWRFPPRSELDRQSARIRAGLAGQG